MDRREFLQTTAASIGSAVFGPNGSEAVANGTDQAGRTPVDLLVGYTQMAEFEYEGEIWKAFENLGSREGALVLTSGKETKWFSKTAEEVFATGPAPYLGLEFDEIVRSLPDVLAQRVLSSGSDPDEQLVKSAVPPIGIPPPTLPGTMWGVTAAQASTPGTFIGTKEAFDTQPVYPDGSTQTFTSRHYCPEISAVVAEGRFLDGLLGGWLPAIRKVFPMEDGSYWEIIGFPDTKKRGRLIVHTWHRVAHIYGGQVLKVFYQHTYPRFGKVRQLPKPEEFYDALLASVEYWESNLQDLSPVILPRQDWADMAKHAFVKELIVRPRGIEPKYGALDRVYAGSEHDGFPDTFTSAVYTNLEWGRFGTAKDFIKNYFDEFVEDTGAINYRGPETGQYGLMLTLLAKYYRYTGDSTTLLEYRGKIEAIAGLLVDLHEESLRLPPSNPGYGLIHGWSEADTNGMAEPSRYWVPYFGNSAFAVRGFRDLGGVWSAIARTAGQPAMEEIARNLASRSQQLQKALIRSIEGSAHRGMDPTYVSALPGMGQTFFEEARSDPDGVQRFSIRSYMELLQADVLPSDLANLVIDCLRSYGATTLGIPKESREFYDERAPERSMLGFLSYGYAQMLLRLGRSEEFLLFLYAHRYHCHLRGHWTAREAAGISRRTDTYIDPYCTPAQQAIPLLVRWMLVLEDSDADRLYFGRGIPRNWVGSGKPIGIKDAPTRWGRVTFNMAADLRKRTLQATVELPQLVESKPELHFTLRVPEGMHLKGATANGRSAPIAGPGGDTVILRSERHVEVNASYG